METKSLSQPSRYFLSVLEAGVLMVRLTRMGRSDRGSSLVEMALLTPLLVLLVFGAGDFGRVMYYAITMGQAARAGAAYGSQSTGYATDTNGIRLATEEEAQNLGAITVTPQLVCECPSGTVVACTTASCATYGAPLAFVQVTATTTFTPLSALYPGIPNSTTLTRVAKVRVQ